jgi:hypothetical protein
VIRPYRPHLQDGSSSLFLLSCCEVVQDEHACILKIKNEKLSEDLVTNDNQLGPQYIFLEKGRILFSLFFL